MYLVISGTNRPGSNTLKVATRAKKHLEGFIPKGRELRLMDLQNLRQDIFQPSNYGAKPEWFTEEFQNPVLNARGILVVSPEYNGSFPGVMKYFIDMLKFPESLKGVPCAFIGLAAGQFGALRAIEQLEMVFGYRSAHIFGERLFLPGIDTVIQGDGSLGDHEARFTKMLTNFSTFVERVRGG